MQKSNHGADRLESVLKNLATLIEPAKELYRGFRTKTIPWHLCAIPTVAGSLLLTFNLDHWVFRLFHLNELYPYHSWLYKFYAWAITTCGFWFWAWAQVHKRRQKLQVLTHTFKNSGLESKIGRLPNLVFDLPLDSLTRKMRLTNAGFPLSKFKEQSKAIESSLGVYIDDIKERRETRTIDLIYSHFPMPTEVKYEDSAAKGTYAFFVGQTRGQTITSTLRETPHLLVAGPTGGGKSTFLRQLIVHFSVKNEKSRFLLIDLKGGLEFSLFEQRSRFTVVPHVKAAVEELKKFNAVLDDRMALIKANKCKDIDAHFKKEEKSNPKKINLNRHFVVVDEAAEMFLAGHHAKATDVQVAREVLSRIARLGRAVGVHLIVATQRPDTRSLDPQVKANLTGVVCFQMMNDASSIAVLGNGRATDLPKVPGRAIWKNGIDMNEVQTPLLTVEEAEKMLGEPDLQAADSETQEPETKAAPEHNVALIPSQTD